MDGSVTICLERHELQSLTLTLNKILRQQAQQQPVSPFDLPLLYLRSLGDQVDFLLLAWCLYLYRLAPGEDEVVSFVWSVGESSVGLEALDSGKGSFIVRTDEVIDQSESSGGVLGALRRVQEMRERALGSLLDIPGATEEEYAICVREGSSTNSSSAASMAGFLITLKDKQLHVKPHNSIPTSVSQLQTNTFIDILTSLLRNLNQPISAITQPRSHELTQIWEWNKTLPPLLSIGMHEIFTQHAIHNPSHPAVVAHDGSLTYQQLHHLSTQLARLLLRLGIGAGDIVPLCFEKSMWTVVAVLGVMKAGACFSLTDPLSQPEARLRTIATDTGARVVLTSVEQVELGKRIVDQDVLVMAVGPQTFSGFELDTPALPEVRGEALMYVIYTSGSTGKPKGVMISHASYASGAVPRAEAVGYTASSRVFDFASYAFDVSIDCMLCTLAVGGCICVPSNADRMNNMSGAIRDMRVNMVHTTPSIARVLDPDVIPSLDVLGLGGEAVSAGDASVWSQTTKVIVAYGPSECTVGCTINNQVGRGGKMNITIGKGVGGSIWIVDPHDHDKLTPIGGIGELLVEGPIVGDGYLNEPEKTAAVFIEDPTWLVAGDRKRHAGRRGRLYKTGDLVKYDADGSGEIVFVGRKDQQVKIRGQRVELAEVEFHLRKRLPASTRIAVDVVCIGGVGDKSLVAFLAEDSSNQPQTLQEPPALFAPLSPELQKALETMDNDLITEVPSYMVPSAYIPLYTMPAMVSGKTDRKQLHAFAASITRKDLAKLRADLAEGKMEPVTEMEKKLHQIWTTQFGSDVKISRLDNFFAIGGDSLKAMRMVAAARLDGVTLTVQDIFRSPRLCDMANAAGLEDASSASWTMEPFALLNSKDGTNAIKSQVGQLCHIEDSLIEDVYPCTPLQEGLMALSAKVPDAYIAQRIIRVDDLAAAERIYQAFDTVSKDCPILRTRIVQLPGHGLMQVIVADKLPLYRSNSISQYIEDDRQNTMELGTPLVRIAIIEGEDGASVGLTMHHATYDGWSMPLIIERVGKTLTGSQMPKPTPFNAFIDYLVRRDRSESETYWTRQLNGASALQFPTLPHVGYQTRADCLLERYISLPQSSLVGTTVATAIRGAWSLISAQYIGSDVIFGETLTGRNAPIPGVESIEGPMITTVPTRVQVNRELTVTEFLNVIHQQTMDRIPHEHFGLQHIRRLTTDAYNACELRTGLVMHPKTDDDTIPDGEANIAQQFAPANDAEAAREALKFNSFALMLVCSIDANGFLVMASFDTRTVSATQMENCLEKLDHVIQCFFMEPKLALKDISILSNSDVNRVWDLSKTGPLSSVFADKDMGSVFSSVQSTWIVDRLNPDVLLPDGGIGELLVEADTHSESSNIVENPHWILAGCSHVRGRSGRLQHTGLLARYNTDGHIEILGRTEEEESVSHLDQCSNSTDFVEILSEPQRKLAQLWSRVIGIPESDIGLEDSFFALGGDSIMAMKLVSEARPEGLELTVAQIFRNRTLQAMASLQQIKTEVIETTESALNAFSSITEVTDVPTFVSTMIKPALTDPKWEVIDVLPVRPLQAIAINGTINLPRYSARYELFHYTGQVDIARLSNSCQELVNRNEILRTVYVEANSQYYGAVLRDLPTQMLQFDAGDTDIQEFSQSWCEADVQQDMPLGAPFAKFAYITSSTGASTLIFRISHAQYDEICLPHLLHQLSSLYENRPINPEHTGIPFSHFVNHVLHKTIPKSKPYWRNLLQDSSMTILRPSIPLTHTTAVYMLSDPIDISTRHDRGSFTVATYPTAVWALYLARHLHILDVTFGEVVTGRNAGLPNADKVIGPCWQYVPFRLRLDRSWTVADLLAAVQTQHIATTEHEGMGLEEIVRECTDWSPSEVDWFDTVLHQDVDHVKTLGFSGSDSDVAGGSESRMETVYPHQEPLREWKIQAFHDAEAETLRLEVVARESWRGVGEEILGDVCRLLEVLMGPGDVRLFD